MNQKPQFDRQNQTAMSFEVSPDELSDREIVISILKGNPNHYGFIMKRYNQTMYSVARSIVQQPAQAMDIVQDSHINAFNKLSQFNLELKILPWLCGITRNQALMSLRKQKSEQRLNVIDIHSLEDSSTKLDNQVSRSKANSHMNQQANPEANLENKQLKQLIESTIDSLPEHFRCVFVLRGVEGFSQKETAEILRIEIATVKTRYYRAKQLLQEKIQCYLSHQNIHIYEIGGIHCDRIIHNVLLHIDRQTNSTPLTPD